MISQKAYDENCRIEIIFVVLFGILAHYQYWGLACLALAVALFLRLEIITYVLSKNLMPDEDKEAKQ